MDSHLQPDIFLMDVTMPKLDGIEATRRIKHQHPNAVVIGLSVHDSPQVEKEMRSAGAAAFLNKETAVDQLYETIIAVRNRSNPLTIVQSRTAKSTCCPTGPDLRVYKMIQLRGSNPIARLKRVATGQSFELLDVARFPRLSLNINGLLAFY